MARIQGTTTGGASGTTLPKPGQFANLIQQPLVKTLAGTNTTNVPTFQTIQQPTVRVTSNVTQTPQFVYPNGSSVRPAPTTAQIGAAGAFGSMLPQKPKNFLSNLFSNRPAVLGGSYTPTQPQTTPRVSANAVLGGSFRPVTSRPQQQVGPIQGPPSPYGYRSFNPGETQADLDRRRQITQLTSPYQGSIAALAGANMVEPVQRGFPGTDPRQQVPISAGYLGIPTQSTVEPVPPALSSYGSGYDSGYSPYSNYGYGSGYGYPSYGGGGGGGYYDSVGRVFNWRVATG